MSEWRTYAPLEAQIPLLDAIWSWSEQQPRDTGRVFRVILAHMIDGSAARVLPLAERVAFSFSDMDRDLRSGMSAQSFDEIVGFLASVWMTPEAFGPLARRLGKSPLFDLVRARSADAAGGLDYWLVSGGQWAVVLLESQTREIFCRIARASLIAEPKAQPVTTKNLGLAIYQAGVSAGGMPMTMNLTKLGQRTNESECLPAVLLSLQKADVIEELAFAPPPPSRPTLARFVLRRPSAA